MAQGAETSWRYRLGRAAFRLAPFLLPAVLLDVVFVLEAVERSGGPLCPSFDDAFIHFQYARSFAELHPLSYHAGDPPTTGATSLLYPMVLAPGWLLGFRGMAMVWLAHGVAIGCLGVTSFAAFRLGDRTVGRAEGVAAAASVYLLPAFVFHAFSGMEVALVTATQVAAVTAAVLWITARRRGEARSVRGAWAVVALGVAAVMARPENAAAAAAASLALLVAAADRKQWTRALSALPLAAVGLPALLGWVTTGSRQTNGMVLKWIPADPYRGSEWMETQIVENLEGIWDEVLMGGTVGREIPYAVTVEGYRWVVMAGASLLVLHWVRRFGLAGMACALALVGASTALFFPATYTWFGNLGRYVVPFLPLLSVAAVLGAGAAGRWLSSHMRRKLPLNALLAAVVAGFTFGGLPEAVEVPAQAAAEMCAQQVPMARHIDEALPPDARVAINDAGAIAYLGGRRTYDLVGLTTAGAARPYAAGNGSIFERLESLPESRRPTHFAYYPSWFPNLGLPGELLHAVETPGATHVGGASKELRTMRTELIDSGARPVLGEPPGELVDELDVADLESEAAHDYRMEGASRRSNLARIYPVGSRDVADGGRVLTRHDVFTFHARPGQPATWVIRTDAWHDTQLKLYWNGELLHTLPVQKTRSWTELLVEVPADRMRERNLVERHLDGPRDAGLFHDWLYQPAPAPR